MKNQQNQPSLRNFDDVEGEYLKSLCPEEQRDYLASGSRIMAATLISQAIFQARQSAGMTQAQLAKAIGRQQPFISTLEAGNTVPTLETISAIARATGYRIDLHFEADGEVRVTAA